VPNKNNFAIGAVVFLLVLILLAGLYSSRLGIDERTPLIATAIALIALTIRELLKAWLARSSNVSRANEASRREKADDRPSQI
jgi:hypothetical protein